METVPNASHPAANTARRVPGTPHRCAARILALALSVTLAAAWCVAGSAGLTGCAAQSAGAASASRIAFDAAFAKDYETARSAVTERADDAKLLAVTSTTFSQAHFTPSWTFLFYSRRRASAYTVTVENGKASVRDNPGAAITQDDFDAMADPAAIALDCDEAYGQLAASLDGDGEYLTCRASLTTYNPADDAESNALTWTFSFNEEADLKEIHLDPNAVLAPAATFSVSACAGELASAL